MIERPNFARTRALPDEIPLFPLAGALLLPGGQLPLNIFEPRYLKMIDDTLGRNRIVGMVQPKDRAARGRPPLYAVGCAGRITSFTETGDRRYLIGLTGLKRFDIVRELPVETPYRQAHVDWARFARDEQGDPSAAMIDREGFEEAMRRYLEAEGLKTDWKAVGSAPVEALIASLAMSCPFAPNEKQALLEAETIEARARCLVALMEMTRGGDPDNEPPVQ